MRYHKIEQTSKLKTTEPFVGQSLEEKVRVATSTKAPIEAISPMIYTERKEGVRKDMNIRTDRWDVAQEAMNQISLGRRQKRAERLAAAETAKSGEVAGGKGGAEGPDAN